VRTRNQLEDHNTQLAKAKCKLDILLEDLEAENKNVGPDGVGTPR